MRASSEPPTRFLELEREKKLREKEIASSTPLARSVKAVLGRLAPAKNKDPLAKLQEVRELWRGVVGVEIARRSTPERWREGVLTVAVDTAPLASELQNFGEQTLVAELAKLGLEGIHTIRFKTGRSNRLAGGEGCES